MRTAPEGAAHQPHARKGNRLGALGSGRVAVTRALDRFMAKVDVDPGGCWFWRAYIDPKGYGRFGLDGRNRLAHNVAHELFVGPTPEGLTIDHLCRVRHCVNPAHLEAVTNRENLERGLWPFRRFSSTCRNGHTVTITPHGRRVCRECARAAGRRYDERRREAGLVGIAPRNRTHCPQGHPYDDENTYLYGGRRQCKACRRDASKERRAAASTL
jgi:hypothetical protein